MALDRMQKLVSFGTFIMSCCPFRVFRVDVLQSPWLGKLLLSARSKPLFKFHVFPFVIPIGFTPIASGSAFPFRKLAHVRFLFVHRFPAFDSLAVYLPSAPPSLPGCRSIPRRDPTCGRFCIPSVSCKYIPCLPRSPGNNRFGLPSRILGRSIRWPPVRIGGMLVRPASRRFRSYGRLLIVPMNHLSSAACLKLHRQLILYADHARRVFYQGRQSLLLLFGVYRPANGHFAMVRDNLQAGGRQ